MSEPKPEDTKATHEDLSSTGSDRPVDGTNWDYVKRLAAEKKPRADILQALKARGLDDESAGVLLNSVTGALPPELPDAKLTAGTNALAPSVFSISDIGLTGPSHTVGLYWMGFGAAILLALGVAFILSTALDQTLPDGVAFYAVRLGGFVAMCSVGYGAFRYAQGVTIRRKD